MYLTNEIKKKKLIVVLVSPNRPDSVIFRDDGSVFAHLSRRTIVQGQTDATELHIHDSDVPCVYDQEDLAVRLKIAKKISIYSLPVIMVVVIIMSYYSYAAKPGDLNYVAPGGLPGHTGSRMDMLYIIGGAGLLVLVVWILAKKR